MRTTVDVWTPIVPAPMSTVTVDSVCSTITPESWPPPLR